MAQEVEALSMSASTIGLSLSQSKCELVSAAPMSRVPRVLESFQRAIVSEASMLGAPLSEGKALDTIWAKHKAALERAASRLKLLNSHDALVILKNALSLPKLLFHLRCTFSGNHPTLALLDEELKSMLCQFLNVDLDDHQWDQASLPVKCGGLGIRKPTHVAPSAFLASVAGTSSLVSSILSHRQFSVKYQGETDALTMWSTLGGGTPPSGPFAATQKCWDAAIIKVVVDRLLADAPDDCTKARLLAVSAPHAGDWLNAPPMPAIGLRMSNEAIRVATGLRLEANLCSPHTCPCSAPVDAQGSHGLSCPVKGVLAAN